ncbi:MAG: HAD hydrolase-like protein [Candidatus Margulisiibacteriota bacterium]|jgi:phosphoglycolate phosphatase
MKKTIIWDWNGTLLNDLILCVQILNDMCKKRKIPAITIDDYLTEFTFPVKKFYEKIGFDFSFDDYHQVSEEFITKFNQGVKHCELQKGAFEVLNYLKEAGYQQLVLSAMEQKNLSSLITYFQIAPFFTHVFGTANNFGEGKIREGKKILGSLEADAKQTYLIGDTLHDLEVAKAIGINCIIVANGHQSLNRIKGKNNLVCQNLFELINKGSEIFAS